MAESLRTQLSLEMEQRIDRKLYETGIPMTKEEWQVRVNEMLQKLGVTVQAEGKPQMLEIKEEDDTDAHNLMPDSIRKQLPKLYSTEKELIGDKVAYARYFYL